MKRRFVTYVHGPTSEDFDEIDAPSWNDHNDHTNWLKALQSASDLQAQNIQSNETRIAKAEKNIKWLWGDEHDRTGKCINGHEFRIKKIEDRIARMPDILRDELAKVAKEIFGDKLDAWANIVETARLERKKMAEQLAEAQSLQDVTSAKIKKLEDQLEKTRQALGKVEERLSSVKEVEQRINDDFSAQVAELKLSVPVPKKFAKFQFVQSELASKKEVK